MTTYQPTDKKLHPSLLVTSLHYAVRVKTVSKQVKRKSNSYNKTEKLVGWKTGIKKRKFKSVLLRDNFLTAGFYCTSLVIVTSKNTKAF